MKKKILYGFVAIVLIGIAAGLYMWNKPHKKVEDAKGIAISAADLFKAYSADESKANELYLDKNSDKALDVSGAVDEIDKDQDGGVLLLLETGDPMAKVICRMRENSISAAKGQKVRVKGFCTGSDITGVRLTDCVLE